MPAFTVTAQQQALARTGDRRSPQSQPQQPRRPPVPPVTGRRQLFSLAAPLLFLPWRGCSEGGFYSTGVEGTHGDNCQKIYQPAAAAEKRFAEKQRQEAAAAAAARATAASAPAPQPAAESEREERATLLKEQAAFERAAMAAGQAERTQRVVDNMWQSLE